MAQLIRISCFGNVFQFCFLGLILLLPKQKFFEELQDRKEEFGISDIQLGLTTLEEVFLNIAKKAELESAAADGSLTTLTLTSGESVKVSATISCCCGKLDLLEK